MGSEVDLAKRKRIVYEVEDRKKYIAYNDTKVYASTDIPMAPSASQAGLFLTPREVWAGYSTTDEELHTTVIEFNDKFTRYLYCAKHCDDGLLNVDAYLYRPDFDSKKTVLLIGETSCLPQQDVIDYFVNTKRYNVLVPDYTGVGENSYTFYPDSCQHAAFGKENGKDKPFCVAAKDTSQYLRTLIVRRALILLKEELGETFVIAVGIRNGTETAMAAAGMEKSRICGLGLIAGAGYPEEADIPKYDLSAKNEPSTEELCYAAGVTGVAYLKQYPHPVFAAIGSNGTYSDVDRLASLNVLIDNRLTVAVSRQCTNCIDFKSFLTLTEWADCAFYGSEFPEPPSTQITFNSDGSVYGDIFYDVPIRANKVKLYYSFGNRDHKSRFWCVSTGETVGAKEAIAQIKLETPCDCLFYYAETTYVNGLTVTEIPKYADLSHKRLRDARKKNRNVIYAFDEDNKTTFCEASDKAVLMHNNVEIFTTPSGVSGPVCKTGGMFFFVGDIIQNVDKNKILRIDTFSAEARYELEISVLRDSPVKRYVARKSCVGGADGFVGTQFLCSDFKDARFRPMSNWNGIVAFTVTTKNVVVGKMMFI